ncbi:hypothetical protein [Propionivibrio sp.]|uniref:hypothetical protein n=1 Tax=Propionivibrio sp. TaxID=2212460 RepID=UPI0025DE4C07|nr:hypothetical protein [Propionivibrio sp.]
MELGADLAVVMAVGSVLVEPLSGWTDTGTGLRIVVEILGPVVTGGLLGMGLVVERIGLGRVPGLVVKRSSRWRIWLSAISAGRCVSASALRLASLW